MQSCSMQLQERDCIIDRLTRELRHQRELALRQLSDMQHEADQRDASVSASYETIVNRNYKMIDQLIEEKKLVHTKCEALVVELKSSSDKHAKMVKQLEEK